MVEESLYHVFVSHATRDKRLARSLCERIEAIGLTTFRDDRDIRGGDDIPDTIVNAIRCSLEVAVLLTPNSVSRTWIAVEIGMAMMAKKRIVPLLHRTKSSDIPDAVRDRRGYDMKRLDEYLNDLRARYLDLESQP